MAVCLLLSAHRAVVFAIAQLSCCEMLADRQSYRDVDRNTSHPYRGSNYETSMLSLAGRLLQSVVSVYPTVCLFVCFHSVL